VTCESLVFGQVVVYVVFLVGMLLNFWLLWNVGVLILGTFYIESCEMNYSCMSHLYCMTCIFFLLFLAYFLFVQFS
jgi:hypothetical protein